VTSTPLGGMTILGVLHEPTITREGRDRAVTVCGRCGSLWPCLAVFQHRAAVIDEGEKHAPGPSSWRFGLWGSLGPIEVRLCAKCLRCWPCRERLAAECVRARR
jgi:hypothetical protein